MKTMAVIAVLLGAALSAQEGAPTGRPTWSDEDKAAIDVLRGLRSKEQADAGLLAEQLAEPGERAWPLLFDTLVARRVPSHDDQPLQALSEVQERVILGAIGLLDRDLVLGRVTGLSGTEEDSALALAVIGCLGAVGHGNDFPALFELARPDGKNPLDAQRAAALRRAAASILTRDRRAFEQLVHFRRLTPAQLLPALIGAVGDARDGRGLCYLSEICYWHEDLIAEVLAQVRRIGPSGDASLDDAMRFRIRPYLDEERPALCQAAIPALVALGDQASIGPLIELLPSESKGLHAGALWALRSLTGLELSGNPETWARWHQAEQAWLLRERPRTFQRLRSNDAGEATEALREILEHPLALGELRDALPDLLRNRVPAIRILACSSLANLEVHGAAPKLLWILEDRDKDVARAAWEALRRLTGNDLPLDPEAWSEALGESAAAGA